MPPGWRVACSIALLASLAVTSLTIPAADAQDSGTLPRGSLYVPPDGWDVSAGETMRIGPDTSIFGDGTIRVWGRLIVKGTPQATANFSVPIILGSTGSMEAEHARFWAVTASALEIRAGRANMTDVLFEGNVRAVLVGGDGRLQAERATFRDHPGEALYAEGRSTVTLTNATFTSNGRGAAVYSASDFTIRNSTFERNDQHIVIDLGPWSSPGTIQITGTRFGAPTPSAADLPGILLRHDTPLADGDQRRIVHLSDNDIRNATIGLRAEGRGLLVRSVNDTLIDNLVGLSVQLASVELHNTTLGNERDVESSGRVTFEGATYLRATTTRPIPSPAGEPWLLWAAGIAAVLALAGGFVAARPRRVRVVESRPAAPAPAPAAPEPSPAEDAPALTLTPAERRILEDIDANPDTPQRAVADRLGTTRQALHYHIKKLEARGLVTKVIEGRETRCRVPPLVAERLRTHTESEQKT